MFNSCYYDYIVSLHLNLLIISLPLFFFSFLIMCLLTLFYIHRASFAFLRYCRVGITSKSRRRELAPFLVPRLERVCKSRHGSGETVCLNITAVPVTGSCLRFICNLVDAYIQLSRRLDSKSRSRKLASFIAPP